MCLYIVVDPCYPVDSRFVQLKQAIIVEERDFHFIDTGSMTHYYPEVVAE